MILIIRMIRPFANDLNHVAKRTHRYNLFLQEIRITFRNRPFVKSKTFFTIYLDSVAKRTLLWMWDNFLPMVQFIRTFMDIKFEFLSSQLWLSIYGASVDRREQRNWWRRLWWGWWWQWLVPGWVKWVSVDRRAMAAIFLCTRSLLDTSSAPDPLLDTLFGDTLHNFTCGQWLEPHEYPLLLEQYCPLLYFWSFYQLHNESCTYVIWLWK